MKVKIGLGLFTTDKVASICNGTIYSTTNEKNAVFENICTDSREADNTSMFVALPGEKVDGHNYISDAVKAGCRCVIAERLPLDVKGVIVVLVENTIKAIKDIACYVREKIKSKIIAVTGSVGKTTTKELIASVVNQKRRCYKTVGNYNSTIGMPMSMLELAPTDNTAVLEMGMGALGEIEYMSEIAKPDIAVVTNIGSAHLESLGSRENICKAKMEIISGLKPGGTLLLNGDEPLLKGYKDDIHNVFYYGIENEECDYSAYNIRDTVSGLAFDLKTPTKVYKNIVINLHGNHNVYNAMVAFITGLRMRIAEAKIRAGLLEYKTVGMRQHIYELAQVTIIEDCYNASPESMIASINVLRNLSASSNKRSIAILGDMKELGETSKELHHKVGIALAETNAEYLFTYGELSEEIANAAAQHGMAKERIYKCSPSDLTSLSHTLLHILRPDDVLLVKGSRAMKMEEIIDSIKPTLYKKEEKMREKMKEREALASLLTYKTKEKEKENMKEGNPEVAGGVV